MNIHDQLKALRIDAGLTQTEIAERLGSGYTRQVVSAIETGTRAVGVRIIQSWADACGYDWEVRFARRDSEAGRVASGKAGEKIN